MDRLQSARIVNQTLVITLVLTGCLGLSKMVWAQPNTFNPSELGPQVGEAVPDFTLLDHRGETRTLESLYGPRGLMLVFSRSADW
ncbi:MAG TPA: hypothetical protein QGH09_07490 [Vicinamibacterales bacterium]|jgi:hypothetical protein|nr:hypothetical protein [Acidobacteriota bacterium]HJO18023.1 hypothetical protein [Vicinamibacterales bacterium]